MHPSSENIHLHLIIRTTLSEGLSKGIVINLQLGHLVVLVGSDSNKSALHQVVGEYWLLDTLGDELGYDHSGLVLVH